MKCPSCANNQRRKREGMRCVKCGYGFVYDPKVEPNMSDVAVLSLLQMASANGRQAFSAAQIQSALLRKPSKERAVGFVIGFVFCALGGIFSSVWGTPIPLIGSMLFAAFVVVKTFNSHLQPDGPQSQALLDRLPMLLAKHEDKYGRLFVENEPRRQLPPAGSTTSFPDVFDYGVERVLLVDHPRLVALLVANSIHADHRCAILSTSGDPEHLRNAVNAALEESPTLPVFCLHGTDVDTLPIPAWLHADGHPIIDIGCSLEDLRALRPLQHLSKKTSRPLPADIIPNAVLHAILERCFATETSLRELLAAHGDGIADDILSAVAIGDFG